MNVQLFWLFVNFLGVLLSLEILRGKLTRVRPKIDPLRMPNVLLQCSKFSLDYQPLFEKCTGTSRKELNGRIEDRIR